MLDLTKISRKSDVKSIWNILGSKWRNIRANKATADGIESLWATNEILASGRINGLLNIYNRQAQLNLFGMKDIFVLEDLSSNIKKPRKDGFNYEFKIQYEDVKCINGAKTKYIFSPIYFTNTVVPPEYLPIIYQGYISKIRPKQNKINITKDTVFNTNGYKLKGYIFYDKRKIPFIIKSVGKDFIIYESLFIDFEPVEGEIIIVDKYELRINENFISENYDNLLKLRFKPFPVISTLLDEPKDVFNTNIDLFTLNMLILDNMIEQHFGSTIGVKPEHTEAFKISGDDAYSVDQKIIKLWRTNQRPYNFMQVFRLASILSDFKSIESIDNPEIIYQIDKPGKKIYTGKLKEEVIGTLASFNTMASSLQTIYDNPKYDKTEYSVVKLEVKYNTYGLDNGDIIIIDDVMYKIKKIYGEKYIQLDGVVAEGPYFRTLKIIPKESIKIYDVEPYGFEEQYDPTLDKHDKLNLGIVKFGNEKWGNFKWGDMLFKTVNSICEFETPLVGSEFYYGDALNQLILLDYFEEGQPSYYIQRALASENKEFSQLNADTLNKNKVLLIAPFLSYSHRFSINEVDLRTETNWVLSGGTTTELIQRTNYIFAYSKVNFASAGDYIYQPIDLSTNNTNGLSLLRLFIKKNSGKVKIGINNDASFLTMTTKKIITDIQNNEWNVINIFIDRDIINQDSNKIFIEAFEDNTEIEIFGIEFWNNVPAYLEKLIKNKQILTDFINSTDYRTINIL